MQSLESHFSFFKKTNRKKQKESYLKNKIAFLYAIQFTQCVPFPKNIRNARLALMFFLFQISNIPPSGELAGIHDEQLGHHFQVLLIEY